MTTYLATGYSRSALRCLPVVALILAANIAHAQNTPLDDMRRQLDAMRRRTDSLQKRTDSLAKALSDFIAQHERQHDADDKNEQIKEAQEKNEERELDKRLDGIEARLAAATRDGGTPNKSSSPASVVRAPFVIQDNDGSVIFRVTGGKSPRLMIGEDGGGGVELGTGSAGGGILRVRDAGNSDRVILIASDGFGQLRAMSQTHSAVLTSNEAEHGALLSLFIRDQPTVRVRSGVETTGGFYLGDVNGTELVGAGGAPGEKGVVGLVRTGPKRRPGSLGPPSILMGAR
ncbi:MAG: hypothetical protein AB1762_17145 [Gemmatimonadota bacterium]